MLRMSSLLMIITIDLFIVVLFEIFYFLKFL